MSEQLSLLGPVGQINKYFFAFFPDAETATRIDSMAQAFRRDLGLTGKTLQPGRYHITLAHLGDYEGAPADMIAKMHKAGAALAAAPVSITFDRAESFPGSGAFTLRGDEGAAGVESFQRTLHEAMSKNGLARWAKPYTPHMTLLYDPRVVPAQPIAPFTWTASEFVLVQSVQGKTEHIHLARWTLH